MTKTKWPETLSPFFCWFCSHLYCFFRKPHSTINRLSFFLFSFKTNLWNLLENFAWRFMEMHWRRYKCGVCDITIFFFLPQNSVLVQTFWKTGAGRREKKVDFPHFWEVAGQDKAAFYYKIHWWTESCILWYVGYFLLCYCIGKNLIQKNLVVKYTKFRACLNFYQCATTVFVWLYLVKLLLI